jgi:Ca2+-binding RTX toxin-like protein
VLRLLFLATDDVARGTAPSRRATILRRLLPAALVVFTLVIPGVVPSRAKAAEPVSSGTGDVLIHQDTQPNDPVTFNFNGSWGDFVLADDGNEVDDGTWNTITTSFAPPGAYWVSQGIVGDWPLSQINCGDPDGGTTIDVANRTVNIDLDAGETIDCTFVNAGTGTPPPVPQPGPTPKCNGKDATIVAAVGAAAVRGTQGPDVIVGLSGNVRIDGRGGNDTICAGPGDNIINGGAGDDWIDAGDGKNTVDTGTGTNTVTAGSGNDTIVGSSGNDTADGGDGANLITLAGGNDVIVAGSGNDVVDGGRGFDTCNAGGGTNSVNRCEA